MEEAINVVTLEDGIEYTVIDEITIEDKKYIYLSSINNDNDFCIRKVVVIENEEYIIGLEDDKEFDLALTTFAKNHNEVIDDL